MAKNIYSLQLLRNGRVYASKTAAKQALQNAEALADVAKKDGVAVLARYLETLTGGGQVVKTLVGYYAKADEITDAGSAASHMTIMDFDSSSVEALEEKVQELQGALGTGFTTANTVADAIEEVNDKLGDDVTTANTVSDQLAALSGTPSDTSASTSVEGAKKYADEKIAQAVDGLDYTDTAVTGSYVSAVDETDGVITVTREALPTVAAISEAGKPITAVSESLGEVSATAGTINAEFVNVANTGFTGQTVEGVLAEIDAEYKAADVALKAEILGGASASADTLGELEAIINSISAEAKEYHIVKSTTSLPADIKERYSLVDAAGNVSGDTIDIPKDSHIVSITYITDTGDTHYQNLEYVYIDASGETKTTYIDMSQLVLESEFASGVTSTNGVVHGVIDPTSETFLTVGADGFKLSGVEDAIDDAVSGAVEDLDADVSGSSTHVSVEVVEADGVITTVTVTEDDIASAASLNELSGKTVTAITSTNGSITASIDEAVGNKTYDIETDASKIQMSGFTAAQSGFTSITEASSVTDAFKAVEAFVLDNEEVVSAALNDLEETKAEITYVETVSGNLQTQIDSLQSGSTKVLDDEIANRMTVEGQPNASAYTKSTSSPYISGATDMTNADELLASALNNVETNMVSGATMNGSAVTKSNESLAFTAVAATGASNSANAIVIDTDANGGLHFSLGTLDAGYYDA